MKRVPKVGSLAILAERAFGTLAKQYAQRKSRAESQVAARHWATKPVWNLNPLYFEMHGERPGRNLQGKPASLNRAFSYGTDTSGRVVVEYLHSEFGPYAKFYDWSKNPVEIAYFDSDKKPLNLQLARYRGDHLLQTASAALRGARMETYHWDGSLLTKIEIRAAARTGKGLQKLTPYQEARAKYDREGQVQRVEIDWLPRPPHQPERKKQIVFERRDKPIEIDLRKDERAIRKMLAQAGRRYASRHTDRKAAQRCPPLTRIDLHYSLGDSLSTPWIALCLDSAAGAQPGDGYSHANFAMLLRKDWLSAVQLVNDGRKVDVVTTDGKPRKLGASGLGRAIGAFLVSALLTARKDGVFAALPLANGCELGVEDPTTGDFGWPSYSDRGKDNLVGTNPASDRGRHKASRASKSSSRHGGLRS